MALLAPFVLTLASLQGVANAKVRNADAEVIESALAQFFTPMKEEWQDSGWREGKAILLWDQFRRKTRVPATALLKDWIQSNSFYESNPKYAATVKKKLAPLRALETEIGPSPSTFAPPAVLPLARLAFGPRIVVGEPKGRTYFEEIKLPNGAKPRTIARIEPPAYSGDGQVALVKISAPWSIHSADILIALRKRDGVWTRVFARSVFYV